MVFLSEVLRGDEMVGKRLSLLESFCFKIEVLLRVSCLLILLIEMSLILIKNTSTSSFENFGWGIKVHVQLLCPYCPHLVHWFLGLVYFQLNCKKPVLNLPGIVKQNNNTVEKVNVRSIEWINFIILNKINIFF